MLRITLMTLAAIAAMYWANAFAQGGGAIPGGIYEAISENEGGCDGANIEASEGFTIRISPDGTRIVELTPRNVVFMGTVIESVSLPADVTVAPDGRFSGSISLPPIEIISEGRFDGDMVSGSFRVEFDGVVECEGTFVGHGTVPPPTPSQGSTMSGEIEWLGDGCGGGSISLTVSHRSRSLLQVYVDGLNVMGTPTSGRGIFAEDTVPIDANGSFDWVYFPGPALGQEIALIGTVTFLPATIVLGPLDGTTTELAAVVRGGITASPSECGVAQFTAGHPATSNALRDGVLALPITGSGSDENWPSSALLLSLAGAGFAIALLGVRLRTMR